MVPTSLKIFIFSGTAYWQKARIEMLNDIFSPLAREVITPLGDGLFVSAVSINGFCRDCKFWCVTQADGWGACLRVDKPNALMQIDGVYGLDTAPDFGCIHFEVKDGDE